MNLHPNGPNPTPFDQSMEEWPLKTSSYLQDDASLLFPVQSYQLCKMGHLYIRKMNHLPDEVKAQFESGKSHLLCRCWSRSSTMLPRIRARSGWTASGKWAMVSLVSWRHQLWAGRLCHSIGDLIWLMTQRLWDRVRTRSLIMNAASQAETWSEGWSPGNAPVLQDVLRRYRSRTIQNFNKRHYNKAHRRLTALMASQKRQDQLIQFIEYRFTLGEDSSRKVPFRDTLRKYLEIQQKETQTAEKVVYADNVPSAAKYCLQGWNGRLSGMDIYAQTDACTFCSCRNE